MRLAVLYMLLALAAVSFAQEECKGVCELFANWEAVAWLTVLISFFVTSLAFMVGRGFGLREIESWGKEELYQAIASAVILGAFMGVVAIMEESSKQLAGDILTAGFTATTFGTGVALRWQYNGDSSVRWSKISYGGAIGREVACGANDPQAACHFYIARAFLGSTFEKLSEQAREAAKLYNYFILMDTMSVGFSVNILAKLVTFGFATPIMGGHSIYYETIETIFSMMAKMLLLLKFQEISLMYIERGIFPGMMVAGLIFRSIWFMRKLGGLLLALAIGLYTIFPFMYVLSWYTMDASQARYDVSALKDYLEGRSAAVEGALLEEKTGGEAELFGAVVFSGDDAFFTKWRPDGSVEYYGMADLAGRYALIAMATPMIALFVLLGFVRELSGFLGGDIEIAGLTRII